MASALTALFTVSCCKFSLVPVVLKRIQSFVDFKYNVTATSAVEEGADVVVIASSDGPVSRGGSNAAFNTRLTHELGLDFTREEIEPIFQEIFASNSFRLDQEKWWLVYNESGKAMNWLMDKMEPYGISAVIENNQRDGGTDWWDGGPLKTLNVSSKR